MYHKTKRIFFQEKRFLNRMFIIQEIKIDFSEEIDKGKVSDNVYIDT